MCVYSCVLTPAEMNQLLASFRLLKNVINATFRGQDLLCVGVSAIPTAPEIIYNRKTDFGDLTSRDNIFQKEEKKMNRGYQTLVILFIYILT